MQLEIRVTQRVCDSVLEVGRDQVGSSRAFFWRGAVSPARLAVGQGQSCCSRSRTRFAPVPAPDPADPAGAGGRARRHPSFAPQTPPTTTPPHPLPPTPAPRPAFTQPPINTRHAHALDEMARRAHSTVWWTQSYVSQCLDKGGCVLGVSRLGNAVLCVRVRTCALGHLRWYIVGPFRRHTRRRKRSCCSSSPSPPPYRCARRVTRPCVRDVFVVAAAAVFKSALLFSGGVGGSSPVGRRPTHYSACAGRRNCLVLNVRSKEETNAGIHASFRAGWLRSC
jgi:hypothetical protein